VTADCSNPAAESGISGFFANYRVQQILIAPLDLDSDCIDEVYEQPRRNPLNPADADEAVLSFDGDAGRTSKKTETAPILNFHERLESRDPLTDTASLATAAARLPSASRG
jgi:hypothetical protein